MSSGSIILSLFLSIKKAEIRKIMGMLMLTQKKTLCFEEMCIQSNDRESVRCKIKNTASLKITVQKALN